MKIGDKIEILEDAQGSRGWWKKGDVYTLTNIYDGYFSVKRLSDNKTNSWDINHVNFRVLNQTNYYFY